MSRDRELQDAMNKLLENHPELRKDAPSTNELRYFLLFQEYIDFDPTDSEIELAYTLCILEDHCKEIAEDSW